MRRRAVLACWCLLLSGHAMAQVSPSQGVENWKDHLTPAAIDSLKDLYSTSPPAMFASKGQRPSPGISPELDFWQHLVSSGATAFEVHAVEESDRQGLHLFTLAVSMKLNTPDGQRTRYVTEQQAWQAQPAGWRILIATHSDVVKMPPALKQNPNLYDTHADAKAEIADALSRAKKDRRRVILIFGANWCYDCHVLDQAFRQTDVVTLLQKNFQIVHVDIGDDGKKNNDLAAEYQVPLNKGVPALAVLDAGGALLFAQKNGEWESARSMDPDDIFTFLEKWKP